MFGMEKEKKKVEPFVFDLEKDLKDAGKRKELASRIGMRIERIKKALHEGSKKEDFDQLGILLNGYHALAIVLGRASAAGAPKEEKKK